MRRRVRCAAADRGGRHSRNRLSMGYFAIRSARIVGERHLKMWVEVPRSGRAFDAIAFNYVSADGASALPEGSAQLIYRLDINEYQGERRLQLLVDHVLPAPKWQLPRAPISITAMELNLLKRQLRDLAERIGSLRGFL